jgi:hypothetical protein
MAIKSNLASRVGKALFMAGILGCVLLGHDTGQLARLSRPGCFGVAGIGALLMGGFAENREFQGARIFPKAIPFVRFGFMLLGGSFVLAALVFLATQETSHQ